MRDWLPPFYTREPFFGTDRDPYIELPNGYVIRPCRYIPDFELRSWRERLFTRPWTPFTRTKPMSRAVICGKEILVSWATFAKIK